MNDTPKSRTRPGKQPDDMRSRLLREMRSATRDYIATLEIQLAALEAANMTEGDPEMATIRTALRVATGARSGGAGYAFGTAVNLERLLTELLREEETTT